MYDEFIFHKGPDYLFIDWMLGNTCNFSCSYCNPEVHNGTVPWIDIKQIDGLITQIKNVYKAKDFRLYNLLGGEPTVWPKLPQFIKKIKTLDESAMVRIHTNGGRTTRWWKENSNLMDEVLISCHPEFINIDMTCKNINVLEKNNVNVSTLIAMQPANWDKCINIATKIKNNCNAIITMKPLQKMLGSGVSMEYTEEQKEIITDWNNIKNHTMNFTSRSMKWKNSKTGAEEIVENVEQLIIDDQNHWRDWNCYIGLDSLFIRPWGDIKVGSLCNPDYIIGNYITSNKISWPTKPIRCNYDSCFCGADMATRKHR